MKLQPFKEWIRPTLESGETVVSYVAIRTDEPNRSGLLSSTDKLHIVMPFREDGTDKAGVMQISEDSGLGLPAYYQWRSRSGCIFCFYQQKIEWVGLLEHHPEAFIRAMELEKSALQNRPAFTRSQGESLAELSKPERIKEIKEDFEKRKANLTAARRANPLRVGLEDIDTDTVYGCEEGKGSCAFCMK